VHDLLWFLVIDKWIGRNMKFLLAYALAHIRLVLGTTWRAACGLRWQAIALAQAFDRGPLGSRPPPPIFA
jgi:hypothetical protein